MNNPESTPRHVLELTDLTAAEIETVLTLSETPLDQLGSPLDRQGAALIFEKPSNRTRHSMEMAVVQLGGHPVYTRGDEVGFDVEDVVDGLPWVRSHGPRHHQLYVARLLSARKR